jgi:hypothetical protein
VRLFWGWSRANCADQALSELHFAVPLWQFAPSPCIAAHSVGEVNYEVRGNLRPLPAASMRPNRIIVGQLDNRVFDHRSNFQHETLRLRFAQRGSQIMTTFQLTAFENQKSF